MTMLMEKYRPASTKDFVGNSAALQEIRKFLLTWQKGSALIVHGPSGTGKTLAVKLIANEMGYELLETGADRERRAASMDDFITASTQYSFSRRKKLILMDDMELLESQKSVTELIEKSLYPVVMIVENAYRS